MIYFPAKSFCRSAGERLSTDHHLTTYLSGLFRRIIFTLPHSFMLTATSAGICAHRTNSRAVSLHIAGCHSSPTRKAAGSNPVGRTTPEWTLLHSKSPAKRLGFSYAAPSFLLFPANFCGGPPKKPCIAFGPFAQNRRACFFGSCAPREKML